MMIEGTAEFMPTDDAAPGQEERSIGQAVERLIGAGKELAQAELELAKRRGGLLAGAATWIGVLALVAIVTAFGLIVTLMIGAVLALEPLWGLGLSLLAVTSAALLIVVICVLGIKLHVGRIGSILK